MEVDRKRKRLSKVTVACPIVYGSFALWLGKKADETATHKWTLFVRGPNDEDLSVFISQVVFSLHPSFAEPIRVASEPPFEVTETGWGEFDAGIRIFFKDPDEQPLDLNHQIKLYHPPPQPPSIKKPVMSEFYDEIVFTDPHEDFHLQLLQYTKPRNRPKTHMSEFYTVFDDEADLQQLTFIQDHISREIDLAKIKLIQMDAELMQLQGIVGPVAATSQSIKSESDSGGGGGSSSSSSGGRGGSSGGGSSIKLEHDKEGSEHGREVKDKETSKPKTSKGISRKAAAAAAAAAAASASAMVATVSEGKSRGSSKGGGGDISHE